MNTLNFKATVWQTLIRFERQNNFFNPGQSVLVGLSGGADSVALLHFVSYMARKKGFGVYAAHINHNLREEAARDAEFSKKTAAALGVPFVLKKVNVKALSKEENLSTEHAARKARYFALCAVAGKFGCKAIALAHHADDNAETFLLNLLRGTKAKGLLGIPARRKEGRFEIIRPFLAITKRDVLNYIKANKLSFIEDESNYEDIYTRNWVRSKLIPLLQTKQPKIREHLLAISADFAKLLVENQRKNKRDKNESQSK